MTVKVLVCKPDGTQIFESRELPSGWFEFTEPEGESPETEEG